ncbi:FAD-dependent oxidoreductase [Desulfovibrio gilichinskyi]|uniref:NADPH-dependent 2,4-dienoyl-CoA reductase, sulfur reductase n=1 Tax=Desulfovibrio gilichinskyi TaxID=1519643 RepID=A0A1X7EKE0_9BACT|nr:FAD-dependent oxidoreductase [Desulfovibrio gilichinskyi]SMF35305.1 NADPH-dependent 2,4-dienoyl-CoA reductase, sulfur reductase [Desulfovibrio gilichinskyi]
MSSQNIVVIGGSAAGPKAAARAKRLDQAANVTLLQKAPEMSMASCGYPYYIGGNFDNRDQLLSTPTGVVRNEAFFAGAKGVQARVNTEVTAIDRIKKVVSCVNVITGEKDTVPYDKLVICSGATPRHPPIKGINLEGVQALSEMRDADKLRELRDSGKVKDVVIVGGGLIGIEVCEALADSGMNVNVVEMLSQLLMFLDWELAKLVEKHVASKGVTVHTENGVAEFMGENGKLTGVKLNDGSVVPCELAVVSIGVVPNVDLARASGLEIGGFGGIVVDEHMRTSDSNIYAAGDCVEIPNRITGKKTYAPYGDLANLEARVAADNIVLGDSSTFPGTVNSGICKVFNFSAGSTGMSEKRAEAEGYEVVTATNASPDKPGFMGAKLLVSKMVADAKTGRILGFQCVGTGEVNRQVAEAAMAVMNGNTIYDIGVADLPYAPPFSLAIDHFIATAHILENKMAGLMTGICNAEVKEMIDGGTAPFILDVRSPVEFKEMRLNVGETLIPLGTLRNSLDKLPSDKSAEIITFCKISMRGYEAQRVLEANGWTNVKVMEGGIMAWPFKVEF